MDPRTRKVLKQLIEAVIAGDFDEGDIRPTNNYRPEGNYRPDDNYRPAGNYRPEGNYRPSDAKAYIGMTEPDAPTDSTEDGEGDNEEGGDEETPNIFGDSTFGNPAGAGDEQEHNVGLDSADRPK